MTAVQTLRRLDWSILASVILLTLLSVVLLTTAGEATGGRTLAIRQGIFFSLAIAAALVCSRTHYSVFRSLAGLSYVVVLLLLLGALVQGRAIRGTTAWLTLGSIRLQPAEFMKFALVLILARMISGNRGPFVSRARFVAVLIAVSLPVALILLQPDLGSAALLAMTAVGMLAVAGLSRAHKITLFFAAVLVAVASWEFLLAGYQKERLFVFLNPQHDPHGSGYAILQAQTAFGSGGLTGRGLGWGSQSRLNFLPEAHTDFIFARIGEELGLIGVLLTLALFGLLFHRILRAADKTSDPFGRSLAVGSALSLFVGLCVNAGMNIGLLPVTGVPLPFVSYGGSSLLSSYLLLGLALSVTVHGERWTAGGDQEETPLVESP